MTSKPLNELSGLIYDPQDLPDISLQRLKPLSMPLKGVNNILLTPASPIKAITRAGPLFT